MRFKALPVGSRFQALHEQQARASVWMNGLVIAGAVVAFGVDVLLTVLPRPAIVFSGSRAPSPRSNRHGWRVASIGAKSSSAV
jgi:hypothetical protein